MSGNLFGWTALLKNQLGACFTGLLSSLHPLASCILLGPARCAVGDSTTRKSGKILPTLRGRWLADK